MKDKTIAVARMALSLELDKTALVLLAGALVPFFFHALPYSGGTPLGSIWLPLFYAPLAAVLICRRALPLAAALCGPLLNHWLTGWPAGPLLLELTLQLTVFVSILLVLFHFFKKMIFAGPLAYLAMKSVFLLLRANSAGDFNWLTFLAQQVCQPAPGLFVLFSLNLCLVAWREKSA